MNSETAPAPEKSSSADNKAVSQIPGPEIQAGVTLERFEQLEGRVGKLEIPIPVTQEQFDRLESQVRQLGLQKPSNWVAPCALGVSVISALVTVLLLFTPFSRFTYRSPDTSIVEKGHSVTATYDASTRELRLTFDITVLNSGNRDGQIQGDKATLANDEAAQNDFVPFGASDIQLSTTAQPHSVAITIPKGDTIERVTCTLDYSVGSIGESVLRKPGAKILTVNLRGQSDLPVLKYYLDWNPNLLDSSSPSSKVYHVK